MNKVYLQGWFYPQILREMSGFPLSQRKQMQRECRESKTPGNRSWSPTSPAEGWAHGEPSIANRKSGATSLLGSPDSTAGSHSGKTHSTKGGTGAFPALLPSEIGGEEMGSCLAVDDKAETTGRMCRSCRTSAHVPLPQRPALYNTIPYSASTAKGLLWERKAFHLCP